MKSKALIPVVIGLLSTTVFAVITRNSRNKAFNIDPLDKAYPVKKGSLYRVTAITKNPANQEEINKLEKIFEKLASGLPPERKFKGGIISPFSFYFQMIAPDNEVIIPRESLKIFNADPNKMHSVSVSEI